MAVTIDGSAGVTTNAGGSVNPSTNISGINYSCRAWVNFNGTGTVAIRASGNVSSITDGGVGIYTINFTTAMSDTNYCLAFGGGLNNTNAIVPTVPINDVAPTTSTCLINTVYANGILIDPAVVYCAIFR